MAVVHSGQGKAARVADPLPCWCSGRWDEVLRAKRFGVLRCSSCKTHRIDPPAIHGDAESANFYTEYYRVDGGARRTANIDLRAAQIWPVFDRVPGLQQPGRIAVEIGCGDGHLCARLKHWGWERVIGFEISASRADRAQELYPEIDIRLGLPGVSELSDGCADLVILEAVIEHIADPVRALANAARLLAPGGRLVLTTPNIGSGNFKMVRGRWTGMLAPHAHLFLFDPDSMTRLLCQAGLNPTNVGSHSMPFLLGSVRGARELLDLKATLWRLLQDAGELYGRFTGRGAMLYAVAARPER